MSKFNTNVAAPAEGKSKKTTNLAGGQAYTQDAKLELSSLVLTSLLEDKYYESASEQVKRLEVLCEKVEPKFIAKLAIYARKTFGVRSVTHVLGVYIANKVKGQSWAKNFLTNLVKRPDDILEMLSLQISKHGRKGIPNSLKKGLGQALSEVDAYGLGKYAKSNSSLKMIDAVNLLHPKHTEALGLLMKGKLESPDTWEKSLTQAGQKAETEEQLNDLKKEEWTRLVAEKKLGYMALMRNLRNILENAPESVSEACKQLVEPNAIKKSMVFPFRFVSALKELKGIPGSTEIIGALSDAAEIALENVPKYEGKTLVVLDVSGSMISAVSGKSKMTCAEIGAMFAAAFVKRSNADFMTFADNAEYRNLNTRDSLFGMCESMRFSSGGTNFHSIFQVAKLKYDRVIILSDMQGWVGNGGLQQSYDAYCNRTNCKPRLYSFDLQGYGTLQFPQPNIFCVAGFSDKIFTVMGLLEQDRNALVNTIEEVSL